MSELPSAVLEGRLRGEDAFYVAADDNPAGVLEKIEWLGPYGVHVLAPGFLDFDPKHLTKLLQEMIDQDKARNAFVILDTLKKAVSLMDKREASGFADFARRFVMRGGTFLGLAHTNKRTDKDGRPIFAGTSDILDDFDCAYTIMEVGESLIGIGTCGAVRLHQKQRQRRSTGCLRVQHRTVAPIHRTSEVCPRSGRHRTFDHLGRDTGGEGCRPNRGD